MRPENVTLKALGARKTFPREPLNVLERDQMIRLAVLRDVQEMHLDRIKQILNEDMSQDRKARYEEASLALDRINSMIAKEESG